MVYLITFQEIVIKYRDLNENGSVKSVKAKKVIMSVPLHFNAKVQWTPPLGSLKQYALDNLSPGHLIKFIVTYEEVEYLSWF